MATDPSADAVCPEELVALILDPATAAEDHHSALVALEGVVRRTAQSCARRLIAAEQVRRDLVEQSFAFVHQRLSQYDPQQGPFLPWLQAVLYHFGLTLRRDWNRG